MGRQGLQELTCALLLLVTACAGGDEIGEDPDLSPQEWSPACQRIKNATGSLLGPIAPYLDGTDSDIATVKTFGVFAGPRIARGAELSLLIHLPYSDYGYTYPEDGAFTLGGTGTLSGLAWEMCSRRSLEALVVVRPEAVGDGAIVVRDAGGQVDAFPFVVAEPTEIALTMEFGRVEATLFDETGSLVHASDIVWQFTPRAQWSFANVAILSSSIDLPEIVMVASYGDLSTRLRVRNDGGDWYVLE